MDTTQSQMRPFSTSGVDMGSWAEVEPLFDILENREIHTTQDMEEWLLDISELSACLSEERTRRYVAMACRMDTDQTSVFQEFMEGVHAKTQPRWHTLNQRYLASAIRSQLPRPRYQVYDRSVELEVRLYQDANTPLKIRESELEREYEKCFGGLTAWYEHREQTLQQLAIFQQHVNPEIRRQAWEVAANRRLQEREHLDDLLSALIEVRTQIARNAGFPNFRDYQHAALGRFDYTPADCEAFHRAIECVVVPVHRQMQEWQRRMLGATVLRPWDIEADPQGRPALHPFANVNEYCSIVSKLLGRIDPAIIGHFEEMRRQGWLDLVNRKDKRPGGFLEVFQHTGHPFIVLNAVGVHRDILIFLHEMGHAWHALACRDEPLLRYREVSIEMAETAAASMEFFAYEQMDAVYQGADLQRARLEQLRFFLLSLSWCAAVDAFQQWLYTYPQHTREERTNQWLSLIRRFGGIEDWSGYESALEALWQRQWHIYIHPLYYIEYGIAQLGALQVWRNSREDHANTLRQYKAALALGNSLPLPKLWATAGIEFDLRQIQMDRAFQPLRQELKTLGCRA